MKIFKNLEIFFWPLESIPGVPGAPLGGPRAPLGAIIPPGGMTIIPWGGMIISHHPPGLGAGLFFGLQDTASVEVCVKAANS